MPIGSDTEIIVQLTAETAQLQAGMDEGAGVAPGLRGGAGEAANFPPYKKAAACRASGASFARP